MRAYGSIALLSTVLLASCNTTGSANPARVVLNGKPLKVDSFGSLNPECGSTGSTSVRVIEQPRSGRVDIRSGMDYPRFNKDNIRAHCNMKRAPSTLVFYVPTPGYKGPDTFQVEAVFPDGTTRTARYQLDVR
jgi:hypothetical protein